MKHRGRHRRRRRGRVLRATLAGTALSLTAAATLISASQATVTDAPGALKPIAASAEDGQLSVAEQRVPERWLDRLASRMGRPVGVGAVLRGADHSLRTAADCSTAEKHTLPIEPAATARTASVTRTPAAGGPAPSPPRVTRTTTAAGARTA